MLCNYGLSTWVESNGGPLLLLARDLLPFWSGIRPSNVSAADFDNVYDYDFDCDYNRACEVKDYLGLIEVASGTGLVLGGEPLSTTWWQIHDDLKLGLLVRWMWADDEASVIQSLANIPESIWEPGNLICHVGTEPLCLFDSAYLGSEIAENKSESLLMEINPGAYSLATADYSPDEETRLILHRFTRLNYPNPSSLPP
jgi:hypothetical protein